MEAIERKTPKVAIIVYTPNGTPFLFRNVVIISTTSPEIEFEGDDSKGERRSILTNLGYILEREMAK